MSADALRAFKLKTAVVTRLAKELDWYMKELESNKAKVAETRGLDKESQNFLKQWEDVTCETQQMIPDSIGRLRTGLEDLQMLLEESPEEEKTTAVYQDAVAARKLGNDTIAVAQKSI